MPFTTVNRLPLSELRAMARGILPDTITDMDFLETLAVNRCLLVPPLVLQTTASGGLRRMLPIIYTIDGELDKARLLFELALKLEPERGPRRFRGRLAF